MATKKEPIVFRKVGQNIKLVIDGETLTRKLTDVEEIKTIKERVVAYNAKPLVKEKKDLIKFMQAPKVEAKKEKAAEATKAPKAPSIKAKKVIEKEPELTKEEQLAATRKLLEDNNYTVNVKATPKTYRRRGEH